MAAEEQTIDQFSIRIDEASLEQDVAMVIDGWRVVEGYEGPGCIGDLVESAAPPHEYALAEVATLGMKSDPT
ncbi:MAG: hypothetical protein ABJA98_09470 [Acidobacteriota bacterium]